jgi:tRNA A37 methylthiotransferase MiaB
LEAVSNECRQKFMRGFLGKKISVLIEGRSKEDPRLLEGLTDNYLQVKLPFRAGLKNKIVPARASKLQNDSIFGEYIDNCGIKCRIKA